MQCLSDEQLARVALGLADSEPLAAHVASCATCQAGLVAFQQLNANLAAAHDKLQSAHETTRERLMAEIARLNWAADGTGGQATRGTRHILPKSVQGFGGLSLPQRIAIGGIGLSTAAGLILLLVVFATSARQLSAMERMVRQLRKVTSYSYKIESHNTVMDEHGKPKITRTQDTTTYWQAPDAFHCDYKFYSIDETLPADQRKPELIEHIAEIFPPGKPGLFVDYMTKTVRRVTYTPTGSETYPLEMLRQIQEGEGKVIRDLGTKEVGGVESRGYVIKLKHTDPDQPESPPRQKLEVWVDAATDLPVAFGYEGTDGSSSFAMKAKDFRWNAKLDSKLFEPTVPEGFVDVTPPRDPRALAQIADALKLYAQLSGGHYPRVAKFEADAVREEMLKLAGFSGPVKSEWKDDPKYQEIEKAAAGLNWVGKIVRNRFHSGYYGLKVGPDDRDKVLLWWTTEYPPAPEGYRVFFGDLRSELLTTEQWDRVAPKQAP